MFLLSWDRVRILIVEPDASWRRTYVLSRAGEA